MVRFAFIALFVLVVLGFAAWATDSITLDGERTVYTATCEQGAWQGASCSGKLAPAQRYRFRALKAHAEVLFWTVGDSQPSGKYSKCVIKGGRDWKCPPNAEAARTITHEMARGLPVRDLAVHPQAFHQIEKWKWGLLELGLPAGSSAM